MDLLWFISTLQGKNQDTNEADSISMQRKGHIFPTPVISYSLQEMIDIPTNTCTPSEGIMDIPINEHTPLALLTGCCEII
jgi:hypothetical protein